MTKSNVISEGKVRLCCLIVNSVIISLEMCLICMPVSVMVNVIQGWISKNSTLGQKPLRRLHPPQQLPSSFAIHIHHNLQKTTVADAH